MKIRVHLHGILRDHLPVEAKGKTTLTLEDGAGISDIVTWLEQIGISRRYELALNGQVIVDDQKLSDGDAIDVFRPAAGG